MIKRRNFLKVALGGVAAACGPRAGAAQTVPAEGPFDPAAIPEMARALAKKPYKAPAADLPDTFASLAYDPYVAIKLKAGGAIWTDEPTGFVLEPLHRGFIFAAPMQVNLVEGGAVRRLVYDAGAFDFGGLKIPAQIGDIGFSGFRILQTQSDAPPIEAAIFQGASFFRAQARGQNFGVIARGLAIRTADPKGEEFPLFRAVWIEKPTLAANALVIHALLDSDSLTGAFRFTLRPGDVTIIDAECTLFARAALDHIGLGAMQATAFYGPLDRRRSDDPRPAVYEVSGLQMRTGKEEWIWRPVTNRETLQISVFGDENPKGFGLIQRERDFDRFQDDDQHWERRPSLWIEPIGDWGAGAVQLIEIPAESEANDNIVAYWRPRAALGAGAEASFAYRQFWCWAVPNKPPLATCVASRSGKAGKKRRFIVEFSGEVFADASRAPEIKPALTASLGQISSLRSFISAERRSCRVLFDLDPAAETQSELRLVLETAGKPISETWLYRWTT